MPPRPIGSPTPGGADALRPGDPWPVRIDVVHGREGETATQGWWLTTRMKQAAPQALVVA